MSAEWPSIADLIVADGPADVALIGAPLEAGSVTPGRCDLAPAAVRKALQRIGAYDVETRQVLDAPVLDRGDLPVSGLMPGEAFAAIGDAVAEATAAHPLTILLGGNNAVSRPAAHGLGAPLDQVGLITLDAHFDMRETTDGPRNGNPVRCLLEDGLPGRNIVQIGLAPFANSVKMHHDALAAGITIFAAADVRAQGIAALVETAIGQLDHAERIMVDFDIDVGGMTALDFFAAARRLAAEPKVRLVDLTEFDPSLDATDLSALTAARWVAEILAGFQQRSRT
jgi:formiminoglutamase